MEFFPRGVEKKRTLGLSEKAAQFPRKKKARNLHSKKGKTM